MSEPPRRPHPPPEPRSFSVGYSGGASNNIHSPPTIDTPRGAWNESASGPSTATSSGVSGNPQPPVNGGNNGSNSGFF
jgi:hypothetical protein